MQAGEGTRPALGTSKRLAEHYDKRAEERLIAQAAAAGPLQSLTARELDEHNQPVTTYPYAAQHRVRAWVRFGPEAVHVEAKLVRSTPKAAGIEFKAQGRVYRCWVWGNAITSLDSPTNRDGGYPSALNNLENL